MRGRKEGREVGLSNMQTEQEGFLSRWSRRKQQTKEPLESEVITDSELQLDSEKALQAENGQAEILVEAEAAEPVLTDADMPPLEMLNEDSDYSGFMSSGVSDELRNLALKKLFKAATFNVCDGLDEYDEDYTSFEKLGDIVTCDMKHQIEVEARKKLEKEEAERHAADQEKESSEQLAQTSESNDSELDDEAEMGEVEIDEIGSDQPVTQLNHSENDVHQPDVSVNASSPINNEINIDSDIETEKL